MVKVMTFTLVFLKHFHDAMNYQLIGMALTIWVVGGTLNKMAAKVKKLRSLPARVSYIWIGYLFGQELMNHVVNNFWASNSHMFETVIAPLAITGLIATISAFLISYVHQQVVGRMRG